jgi:SAM-dependent methyltransferase
VVNANRRYWNEISRAYQADFAAQIGAAPRLWGMFSIPDTELGALGDVTGLRILEVGCGAGPWSRSLAADASLMVGLDLSEVQLEAARAAMRGVRYPLVQAAAEQLPFPDECFDLVCCDHGGLSWAPPDIALPEAARVLRRSGRLVFNVTSPWHDVCYDHEADAVTPRLRHGYFSVGPRDEGDGARTYQLTYGGWIRALRRAGLLIDDLIEPRPAPEAGSGYLNADPPDWAHRWPAEIIWVARKP